MIPRCHPDTKESSLVELRGPRRAEVKSPILELGFEAPPARSDGRDRRGPGARCRRRGSAKPYLTNVCVYPCQVCHWNSLCCGKVLSSPRGRGQHSRQIGIFALT
ncbi:hypothetical protein EYF80_013782 [Liparis tanakae]|uniref:Uncharacterized protein n=1 Tax=Liparis tanakae TaxID=230148 RepID=A0A4Z2ID57_9TELE|nr:hypothetical protein EYF80_013782 [Liparis tanakae]